MRLYLPHAAQHGQISSYKRGLPIWQLVIILMGKTNETSTAEAESAANEAYQPPDCKLVGELISSEEAYLKQFEKDEGQMAVVSVYKQFLAYYLSNVDLAGRLSDKTQGYAQNHSLGNFPGVRHVFFDALTALAMLKMHKGRKWRKRASKNKKQMITWQKKGNPNLTHMILLLEAEEYALSRKPDLQLARSKYDDAISAASRVGFQHDSALGCERAGVFCLERDGHWANIYLSRAHVRWSEYGKNLS